VRLSLLLLKGNRGCPVRWTALRPAAQVLRDGFRELLGNVRAGTWSRIADAKIVASAAGGIPSDVGIVLRYRRFLTIWRVIGRTCRSPRSPGGVREASIRGERRPAEQPRSAARGHRSPPFAPAAAQDVNVRLGALLRAVEHASDKDVVRAEVGPAHRT
jgi:hypothetical protein